MQKQLIAAGIIFAIYKFAPNNAVKAMALGVGGVMAGSYIPYVNGKTVKETTDAMKASA